MVTGIVGAGYLLIAYKHTLTRLSTCVITIVMTIRIGDAEIPQIAEIERWLKRSRISENRLGLLAAANPRAIERIRDETARISTLRAVIRYIRRNNRNRE